MWTLQHNLNYASKFRIIAKMGAVIQSREPVSSPLKGRKVSILQCYAPTNVLYKTPKRDLKILMEDQNSKVEAGNTNKELIMGTHGIGEQNKNGELSQNSVNSRTWSLEALCFPTWKDCLESRELSLEQPALPAAPSKTRTEMQFQARWAEHFTETLNRPAPPVSPGIPQPSELQTSTATFQPRLRSPKQSSLSIQARQQVPTVYHLNH